MPPGREGGPISVNSGISRPHPLAVAFRVARVFEVRIEDVFEYVG